jgi:hypothetical protein
MMASDLADNTAPHSLGIEFGSPVSVSPSDETQYAKYLQMSVLFGVGLCCLSILSAFEFGIFSLLLAAISAAEIIFAVYLLAPRIRFNNRLMRLDGWFDREKYVPGDKAFFVIPDPDSLLKGSTLRFSLISVSSRSEGQGQETIKRQKLADLKWSLADFRGSRAVVIAFIAPVPRLPEPEEKRIMIIVVQCGSGRISYRLPLAGTSL